MFCSAPGWRGWDWVITRVFRIPQRRRPRTGRIWSGQNCFKLFKTKKRMIRPELLQTFERMIRPELLQTFQNKCSQRVGRMIIDQFVQTFKNKYSQRAGRMNRPELVQTFQNKCSGNRRLQFLQQSLPSLIFRLCTKHCRRFSLTSPPLHISSPHPLTTSYLQISSPHLLTTSPLHKFSDLKWYPLISIWQN